MAKVDPVPAGYHTVTPYLVVPGVADLIEFVKKAFGAVELMRHSTGGGAIMHAEVKIGDSRIMMGEPPANAEGWHKPIPGSIHLYVQDVDAVYARAMAAGATSLREPANQFYGDRTAGVQDASGNQWWIATHVEDVSPEELSRRAAAGS
jgi:PhnB protein